MAGAASTGCFSDCRAVRSQSELLSSPDRRPALSRPWLDNNADSGKPLLFATAFNKSCAKQRPTAISWQMISSASYTFCIHSSPHVHLLKKGDMANGDYRKRRPLAHRTHSFVRTPIGSARALFLSSPATPPKASSCSKGAFRPSALSWGGSRFEF